MAAFASVADLEARWRTLSAAEKTQAGVLLGDASAIVRAFSPTVDARVADGSLDADVPKLIVCAIVKRAMLAGDSAGVKTTQETTGPFSQSFTFANPTGDMYLLAAEKRMLRGGARAFMVDLAPPVEVV